MNQQDKEKIYKPGLEGIPACRSSISFVNGIEGILRYRGYLIKDLVEKCSYEQVSYLLFHGQLPTETELKGYTDSLKAHYKMPCHLSELLKTLPKNAHPMSALQTAVASLACFSDYQNEQNKEAVWNSVHQLMVQVPFIIGELYRIRTGLPAIQADTSKGIAANLANYFTKGEPSEYDISTLDACLTLHAEHTLNASTFTARVIASTLTDPYAVIAGAIASLKGRLHGGANEAVMKLLSEIGSVENVRPFVEDAIANKKKIMGIGHRVYKVKDPRATLLQSVANKLFETDDKLLNIAEELEKVCAEKLSQKGLFPNVDFYSGLVYHELGIPTEYFTPIFAAARTSGWLAHWLEQLEGNRIYRPTQIYDGLGPRKI